MDDQLAMLRELCDRREVADVIARFCCLLDEYDIDGAAALLTDDCVSDFGPSRGGVLTGRTAYRDRMVRSQGEFRRTHHQLGQHSAVFVDPDTCQAMTYVTAWHERWDGSRPWVRLRYLDRLVRSPDGWRIARRQALAAGVDGFEGDWEWVPRRVPADRAADGRTAEGTTGGAG